MKSIKAKSKREGTAAGSAGSKGACPAPAVPAADVLLPPSSDTGVAAIATPDGGQPSVAVHWVTASSELPVAALITRVIEHLDCGLIVKGDRGFYGLPEGYEGQAGLQIAGEKGQRSVVAVPGEACESFGGRVLGLLGDVDLRRTRVDLAVDVTGPSFVTALRDSAMSGRTRGVWHKRSVDYHEDYREGGGRTLYLGSVSSRCQACVYDRRGVNRIEFRFHKEGAEAISAVIRSNGLQEAAGQAVRWFFEASDVAPLARLIMPGAKLEMRRERSQSSLADAIEAFRRQQGTTLRLLLKVGVELSELLRGDVLSSRQLLKLERWKAERSCGCIQTVDLTGGECAPF